MGRSALEPFAGLAFISIDTGSFKENGAAIAFASTGIGFDVTGVPLAEDTALINAGLDLSLGPQHQRWRVLLRAVRRRRGRQRHQRPLYLAVLTAVLDASLRRHQSPLRVISGHTDKSAPCPLYPQ